MKLKNIVLHNYRNFEDYEITLGNKTTVFIGKNGMGKTNLISAMVQAMSFVFSKQKGTPQYDFIASSSNRVKSFSATDPFFRNGDYQYPLRIYAEAYIPQKSLQKNIAGNNLIWAFEQESATSGLKDSKFKAVYQNFWEYYNELKEKPVLAFFSDGFPHKNTNLGPNIKDKLESGNPLPANTGYYQWDLEQSCTEIWKIFFSNQWLNNKLQSDKQRQEYVDSIVSVFRTFTEIMSDGINEEMIVDNLSAELRGNRPEMMIEYRDGRRVPFNHLPQGYNRIFSIVLDLANRSFLLNNHCNPEGVVWIDEIELHLHPSVAMEILPRLQKTFPKIQFIVSTHSPLVITNFDQSSDNADDNILYRLYREDNTFKYDKIEDIFGIDYNLGLTDIMQTPQSNRQLGELKKMYLFWKGKDPTKANKIEDIIREKYAQNTRFIQELGL